VTPEGLGLLREPFSPRLRNKLNEIRSDIEQHSKLLRHTATLEDITKAQLDRQQAEKFRNEEAFQSFFNVLQPVTYDARLAEILKQTAKDSGRWLDQNSDFQKWLDPTTRTIHCLWVHGIPGAGKSSANECCCRDFP
jgi:hypothetical protein